MSLLVAGIHTGTGKTVCSAVLAEALHYDYWKPVQAGDLHASDSLFVTHHISNAKTVVHPEAYRLQLAASPHWAARQEGREITLESLSLPVSANRLIVETAGGVMSPLSFSLLNIDLIKHFNLPVVLVSENYLGSINHTLLSITVLKQAGVPLAGIVFNGEEVASTREFILSWSGLPLLFSIPKFEKMDKGVIASFAATISASLKEKLNEPDCKR